MPGAHRPPDHSRGDANTLGGYAAVHARPAAFEGPDGLAYSVEIEVDRTGDASRPWGAFLLFVQWRRTGEPGVEGHLETGFVAHGASAAEARERAGRMSLGEAREALERLVRERAVTQARPLRRWWDVMRDERGEEQS